MRVRGAWRALVIFAGVVGSASVVACAAGDDGSVDLHGPDTNVPSSDAKEPDTTEPPIDSGHFVDSNVTDSATPIDSSTPTDSGAHDSTTADTKPDTKADTKSDSVVVDTMIDAPPLDAGAEPIAGEVVFSEILIDAPTVGSTSEVGEYVELYNASLRAIDLAGCVLRSKSGASTETTPAFGSVTIAPGAFAVLQKASTGETFDYTAAATYTGIAFANSSDDYVALQCAAGDVDGIAWNADADFPIVTASPPANVANERSTASLGAGKDTSSTKWCDATTTHTITGSGGSGTFKGTPGAANDCP